MLRKFKSFPRNQKTRVVDFLSKRVERNRGDLPQHYISNDHEPIIPPEKFKMVQEEMERRRQAGGKAQSVSIFSGRIVCGECGGFYGRKVWHSNTDRRSWHWHCNNRFSKRTYCATPTLNEESFQETFVVAFNRLIRRRAEIEENYRLCLDAITDTSEFERRLDELDKASAETQTLIRALMVESGRSADGKGIAARYEDYEGRLDAIAKEKQELDMKIAERSLKRTQVTAFLMELKKYDQPLKEFDPLVWQATINHARVDKDCTITFFFRDGTEVKAKIKNGVRQYRRRFKEEPDDGQQKADIQDRADPGDEAAEG